MFNDREPLSDVETELNDLHAIQFHTSSDTQQQLCSELSADQVSILAVNVLLNKATDDMTM